MSDSRVISSLGFLTTVAIALAACTTSHAPKPEDWNSDNWVGYRLLAKEDFEAPASHRLWGNIAHAAEICVEIIPSEGPENAATFRSVMNPTCSFGNKIGRVGTLGGLAGVSIIPGLPTQQPDWYVLQHEQIHFAIMEVGARRLSRYLDELPPRTPHGACHRGGLPAHDGASRETPRRIRQRHLGSVRSESTRCLGTRAGDRNARTLRARGQLLGPAP